MSILDRYLGRTVVAGMLLALLILLAVDLFFAFANEMQDIGKGRYGLSEVFIYIGLTVPRRIYEVFPMAALLGSLLTLGALASSSELVAIRAAGVSVLRIAGSVLAAGAVPLLMVAAVGEWVAPHTEQLAQQRRSVAQSETITFRSDHGLWARDGRRFINIRRILPDGQLADVEVFELGDDHQLRAAMRATSATHSGDNWQLNGVRRGELRENGVEVTQANSLEWPSLLSPQLLNVVTIAPQDLSARDLYQYARYMRDNGLDDSRYQLALWQRLLAPAAALVMLFLSLPFVFGPLRSVSAGQRLLWGVLTGVAFYLVNQTLGHMGQVYGLSAPLSAALPPLLFLAGGLWVMQRVR